MTIEQVGSIGELIAAIATVATLAYLAAQIRQANRASRSATAHNSSSLSAEVTLGMAQDPALAEIWFRGLADYDTLSPAEGARFELALSAMMTWARNDFALSAEGLLPADLAESSRSVVQWLSTQPGFKAYFWPKWSETYPRDFATQVDRIIQSSSAAAQQSAAAD